MTEEPELETSANSQKISSGGKTISVEIYRLVGESSWILEVVDEFNNSMVWNNPFDSDESALKEVKSTILSDGIDSLIGEPSENA